MSGSPIALDRLVRTVPCGLAAGRIDGTLTWTNGVLEDWLDRDDLSGQTVQSVFSLASRMMFETHVRPLLLREGIASELSCKLVRSNGGRVPILLTAQYDSKAAEASAVSYAFFCAADRIAYEKRLKAARAEADQLAAIVTDSLDGYVTVSLAGRIVTANRGAGSMLATGDLTNTAVSDVFPDYGKWLEDLHASDDRHARVTRHLRHVRADGDTPDLEVTLSRMKSVATDLLLEEDEQAGVSLVIRDVTERVATRRKLESTVAELNHRVKNTLAIVQSVAAQTFQSVDDRDFRVAAFAARVRAMADAHDVLTERGWQDAELGELITRTLQPVGGPPRIMIDGPPVSLRTEDAVMLAIAIRELGENAARHGALSRESGAVAVSWSLADTGGNVALTWRETGIPDDASFEVRGFGCMVLEQALPAQLGSTASLTASPGGLTYEIELPTRAQVQR